MQQDPYISITELTRYIKRKFDMDGKLQDIWLRGELSNVKHHSRGHMYFTVKDQNSRINSVMFAGNNRFLKFRPEEGMKVLIRGEVSVYEPHGQYQLYVKEMQPDGIGNLFLAFEELKKKLEKEGLFAPERKKKIPATPKRIGVITSPTGAAVRDVLTTIKRRFPIAKVTVMPVLVQGPNAASSISRAIDFANEQGNWDILIVGRGGGSIEELWAFNEEIVARSIFHSIIPIISAVGHETDFTIADFVADIRAATPTAAAEIAVPHIEELQERVTQRQLRLTRAITEHVKRLRNLLDNHQKSYAFRYPLQLVKQKEQDLDRTMERLQKTRSRTFDRKAEQIDQLISRLERNHPERRFNLSKDKHQVLVRMLKKEMRNILDHNSSDFQNKIGKLNALSPLSIMERGYSLAYDQGTENLIKSVKQVQPGDQVTVRLKDGKLDCQVWGLEESEK
ncbi:exodeoxyribonuclease VII large subunit [Pseudalkalibacillus salsuginis]|uniref:exodeoxyribonuclease VII large subunit n=1 Tax=Pseudalkalibacillus salsuginis TaxID=2910972 RepID=UPI001F249339|nr:exodeoxyribonuclease VII large subunit [Pseudalkalibacillus salsuginis]MCF6408395.1 exodeoxyribonuclease VII large subunit [Pseudalkalibacillus salsuginis]